ncbi:MAG: deoxyribodipyrimidine photo-lyase [Candidatus Competibacteraceae bacterium]|nr:deoxyribodipyrimidine photo-lyase [Candidatus Competibacteraceae bacterium]
MIAEWLEQRMRPLNAAPVRARGRDYVLCWLQQALRAADNPIIDAALALGALHGLPVLIYHGLSDRYPHASRRLHRFILQAHRSLARDAAARGLRFCGYVERAEKPEKGLVHRLAARAALVVTDDVPAFVARRHAWQVAARIDVALLAVDACCLVPMSAFPDLLEATPAFRRAHTPQRAPWLEAEAIDLEPRPFDGALDFEPDDLRALDDAGLESLIARCAIDHTLPPAPGFDGGREAALGRLAHAVERVLPDYRSRRNNPADPDSSTKLSPYLHFGVLGVREVARAVRDADFPAASRYKFLDELLTWREYFYHLARFSADPADYANVPEDARRTLAEHAADPRPALYSAEALLRGETADETWNAAQKQYLLEGWMHNNLRMYWGKKLIEWRATPEDAWRIACYLNDRLSLDGRDPATYGNLQWCFGRAKPAWRETPIYGRVARRSDAALRKRPQVADWLREQAQRPAPKVRVEA